MRNLTGIWKWVVFFITAFGVAFIVFTSIWRPYHPALQGSAVLLIGMLLVFLNQPISKEALKKDHSDLMRIILFGSNHSPSVIDLTLTVFGSIPCIFIILYWEPIVTDVPGQNTIYI